MESETIFIIVGILLAVFAIAAGVFWLMLDSWSSRFPGLRREEKRGLSQPDTLTRPSGKTTEPDPPEDTPTTG